MSKNPKIDFEPPFRDKLLDLVGWILLAAFWGLVFLNYSSLPEEIVIHYNGAGEADGWGPKWSILTLPAVATVLAVGLTVICRFPHGYNYPVEITMENAEAQYRNAVLFMRILKLSVILIFILIGIETIGFPLGEGNILSKWFLPLTLLLIFGPVFYFVIRSSR